MFDIVILNGRIVDGSGAKPYIGHIGINGDRISSIERSILLPGYKIIDAEGMIVSPGFVDIHGHSDYFLLLNPLAESKVRQGVTTEIGGNCGYSAAPVFGVEAQERKTQYETQFSLDLNWQTVFEYCSHLERLGISINFALLAGHNTIRASVMGKDDRAPNEKELKEMCAVLENGMKEGAFGLSTGLIYSPACFSNKEEMVVLNHIVKQCGGVFTTHMRSEDDFVLEAIQEVVEVARKASVPLQISHLIWVVSGTILTQTTMYTVTVLDPFSAQKIRPVQSNIVPRPNTDGQSRSANSVYIQVKTQNHSECYRETCYKSRLM